MQTNTFSPYALKDLYQAIDLMDRKIAHSQTRESFDSEEARQTYLRKLCTKRAAHVKSALILTNLGVRCDSQFLPRSFIHPVQHEAGTGIQTSTVTKETKNQKPMRPRQKRS